MICIVKSKKKKKTKTTNQIEGLQIIQQIREDLKIGIEHTRDNTVYIYLFQQSNKYRCPRLNPRKK